VKRLLAVAAIVAAGLLGYATTRPAPGPRNIRHFDARRMADLELGMWRAYYAKENVRLFTLLVTLLREQYRYSWARAVDEGFHLARAAATFGDANGRYDRVLPDLDHAYAAARAWLHAGFDPREVARAELAWWVARRTPGQNAPPNVGRLIANEYALLYEVPRERVATAGLLRAEAAALRDGEAAHPDWDAIGELLRQSYRELLTGVSQEMADNTREVW
jgi:hypothetical protein